MFASAFECNGVRLVADHRHELCVNLSGFDAVDDGLKVGSAAGGEDGNPKRSRSLNRHIRP